MTFVNLSKYFALFILIQMLYLSNSITWSTPEGIRTGMITPFTTFKQQGQSVSYSISYNNSMNTTVKQAAISLIGFSGIVSSSFYYLTNISSFTALNITITVAIKKQTYLTRLNFNYIVLGDPVAGVYLDILSGCFLCNQSVSFGNGTRNQVFDLQQYHTIYTGQISILTSVSSFNISTAEGSSLQFSVRSWMNYNQKTLYQQVTALDFTFVNMMCITSILLDRNNANIATNYSLVYGYATCFANNQSTNLPHFHIYYDQNRNYFGIKAINLGLLYSTIHNLYIDIDSYTDYNQNYSATENIIDIRIQRFSFVQYNCSSTQYYNPNTFLCVASCAPPLYALLPQRRCGSCAATCLSCNGSLSNQCLTCDSTKNRQINSATHTCDCKPQFYQNNQTICASCSSFIPGCLTCINKTHCQTCSSPLSANATTGRCQCANNAYLVSNTCLSYPGCLSINIVSNAVYCNQCDTSLNFIRLMSNYTCACANNFTSVNGTCQAVCGDGILSGSQCDDQNLINGDGCSQTCTIQDGWSCYYNATLIKSVCTINTTFSLQYLYSTKNLEENIANIYFSLTPIFSSLQKMDFAKFCSFSFPYSSLSSTYDSSTGILTLSVNYLQTIQQKPLDLTLDFDQNVVTAPTVSVAFTPQGQNSFLTFDSNSSMVVFIIYGSLVLSALMWIIVIAGSISGQKMVSLQLMLPFQLIYFYLVCSDNKISSIVALQFLKFSSGFNSLDGLTINNKGSNSQNPLFSDEYIQNYNFMMLVNLGILGFLSIMRLIQVFRYRFIKNKKDRIIALRSKQKQDKILAISQIQRVKLKYIQQKEKLRAFRGFTNMLLDKALLIILCGSFLLSSFDASYLSGQKFPSNEMYSPTLNYMACQAGLLLSSLILVLLIDAKNHEIGLWPLTQNQFSIGKIFIVFYIAQSIFLVVMYLTNVIYLIILNLLVSLIPLIFYIIQNPYKVSYPKMLFPYISSVINMIVFTIPLVLLSMIKILPMMSQFLYLLVSMIVLGCCLIGQVIAVIRIVKHYKIGKIQIQKQNSPKKGNGNLNINLEDQNDKFSPSQEVKSNLLNLKTNEQMINWEQKHQQQYESIRMQKQETHESFKKSTYNEDSDNHEQDQDDLALIKKKLRADLRKKRGNY